jgi:predicted permease
VRRFFRRGRLDGERAREIDAHLEHFADDLVAAGWPREQARREARRRFGNPTVIREEIYRMNSVPLLETLGRDLRYALRMLRKTPAFTLIALVTLAVGIGVNTAIFTVVNALLLKPLPFPEPERLATVQTLVRSPRGQSLNEAVDGTTFFAIHDNATTVDSAIAAGGFGGGVNLVAEGVAANVRQQRLSAGYLSILGVPPLIGRDFRPEEDREGGQPVAVLGYDLWARAFNADASIVGRAIMLRGEPYTVVGVMPRGFTTGVPTDVWTPARPSQTGEGGGANYHMIVRVRPGHTWQQANAEIAQLGSPAAIAHFDNRAELTAESRLVPLQQDSTAEIRQPLLMLWGAVGLVLLTACVNLAGLLLARSATRVREIATRMALGSGRAAVIRQLLVETAVLALGGGALGVGVGWLVLAALKNLSVDVYPVGFPLELDWRVLAMTLVLSLATSLVFGLAPALHASRIDVQAALAESGTRGSSAASARWPRRLLVIGEVAMTVVLLVSAGLLVRTFMHLRSLDPGFDPSNVTTATVSLQDKRYEDGEKINRLFADSLARIRRQPGVQAAGITLGLPYTRLLNMGFRRVEGAAADEPGRATNVSYVTPGLIEALRLPLIKGRAFTDADTSTSQPVVIVNDEFVRRFYKGQDVVGQHLRVALREGDTPREIVGVVGSARATSSGLGGDGSPLVVPFVVYIPATQTGDAFFNLVHTWFSPSWVVRSAGPVNGVAEAIRQSIAAVDPLLPIAKMESMVDVQADSLRQQRFTMALVAGLGAVALLLAAIGIHGLIASSVSERTRELGIRLALGASRRRVLLDVVVPGLRLAAIGVIIGAAASVAAAQLLRSFLWGVQPGDPITFAGVVAVLLTVSLVASVLPALRVLRLDPALTLRAE